MDIPGYGDAEIGGEFSGEMVFPRGIEHIEVRHVHYSNQNVNLITSVTIPSSVKTIGAYAFYRCDEIKSIYIPDGVERIGNDAFAWCASLVRASIPSGVILGKGAFSPGVTVTRR